MPEQRVEALPFIDAHCHLFNMLDVPLYECLHHAVHQSTVTKLMLALAAGPAILTDQVDPIVHANRNFIKFFERDITANIKWLDAQLQQAMTNDQIRNYLGRSIQRVVITPLVMDFDDNLEITELGCDHKLCTLQIERLFEAIEKVSAQLEIYPFMGFSLNKLKAGSSALDELKDWWASNGLSAAERYQGATHRLPNGKAIGIKLYPPLGFNPCPADHPDMYLPFYDWCVDEDIPITVHCQPSSFSMDTDDHVNDHTTPTNWKRLFDRFPHLHGLRINFGHFGGEDGVANLVTYGDGGRPTGFNHNSWTYTICNLLKYPNTFADLAAFDFDNTSARNTLERLLSGDEFCHLSELDDLPDILAAKLIWGSDLPMILSSPCFLDNSKPSYTKLLRNLLESGSTSDAQFMGRCRRILCDNPADFLFGRPQGL